MSGDESDCDFFHCYSSSSKRRRQDGHAHGHSFDSHHVISQEEGDSLEDTLMMSSSPPCTKRARYYCPETETASAPPSPGVVSLTPVYTNTNMTVGVGVGESQKKAIPREWWKQPPLPQQHNNKVPSAASSLLESSSVAGFSSSSSSSFNNHLVCVVCQTAYTPCHVEEKPSVMPANALLNYFSCKKKASPPKAAAATTATPTPVQVKSRSTTTNNNNHCTCTFCERSACPDCVHQCEECQQPFCSFCCSTQEYHGTSSYTRTVCLDCCRRDPDPVQQPQPQQDEDNNVNANVDDGMELD